MIKHFDIAYQKYGYVGHWIAPEPMPRQTGRFGPPPGLLRKMTYTYRFAGHQEGMAGFQILLILHIDFDRQIEREISGCSGEHRAWYRRHIARKPTIHDSSFDPSFRTSSS